MASENLIQAQRRYKRWIIKENIEGRAHRLSFEEWLAREKKRASAEESNDKDNEK